MNTRMIGTYSHTVDAKNRVFMPAKFREVLGEEFVIFRSPDEHKLLAMSFEEYDRYTEPFESMTRGPAEKIFRFLSRYAVQATPDAQGRVILSQGLLEYAGIEKSVAIAGCGHYVEIWREDIYNNEDEDDIRALLVDLPYKK